MKPVLKIPIALDQSLHQALAGRNPCQTASACVQHVVQRRFWISSYHVTSQCLQLSNIGQRKNRRAVFPSHVPEKFGVIFDLVAEGLKPPHVLGDGTLAAVEMVVFVVGVTIGVVPNVQIRSPPQ